MTVIKLNVIRNRAVAMRFLATSTVATCYNPVRRNGCKISVLCSVVYNTDTALRARLRTLHRL